MYPSRASLPPSGKKCLSSSNCRVDRSTCINPSAEATQTLGGTAPEEVGIMDATDGAGERAAGAIAGLIRTNQDLELAFFGRGSYFR